MPIQRQLFNIAAAASAVSDTGPSFNGEVVQMRWYPTTPDTGGDLAVDLMPSADPADTGQAYTFFSDNDCLGAAFTRVPYQPMHGSDGAPDPADTGAAFGVPVVSAGERLRIRITPGGAACVGKLYVWIKG